VHTPRPIRVLVADHDRWARLSITSVLRETGFGVHEASNGMSAVRMLADDAPEIVLLGTQLSEISAIDVVRTLRADPRTRHTAVVHVRGDGQASPFDPAIEVDGRVDLPCHPVDLLATLVTALEARRAEVGRRQPRADRAVAAFEPRRSGVGLAHRARTRGRVLVASVDRPG
jgi:CheY-like chemotaxis protein